MSYFKRSLYLSKFSWVFCLLAFSRIRWFFSLNALYVFLVVGYLIVLAFGWMFFLGFHFRCCKLQWIKTASQKRKEISHFQEKVHSFVRYHGWNWVYLYSYAFNSTKRNNLAVKRACMCFLHIRLYVFFSLIFAKDSISVPIG